MHQITERNVKMFSYSPAGTRVIDQSDFWYVYKLDFELLHFQPELEQMRSMEAGQSVSVYTSSKLIAADRWKLTIQ